MPLVRNLIERRSLNDPRTSLSEIMDALDGAPTHSGVTMNETRAMNLSAVFRAVSVVANTIAWVPLKVYQRDGDVKKADTAHPLYRVLHDQPNPEMTSFTWRQVSMFHALFWGGAFSEIEYNGRGEAVHLWPLLPDRVKVERRNDQRVYVVRLMDGSDAVLEDWRVLHIPALGFDGRSGVGLLQRARESFGLSAASEEYGARFFSNGSRSTGVLEHPGVIGKEALERLRKSWTAQQGGLSNAHRVAILEEGMKFNATTIPPEEAQFLETRKFQVVEVARWVGVPPHKLYELDRATFSNIEHQAIEFVGDSIMPWVVLWQQSMDAKLFTKAQQGRYCARFVVDGLQRGDMKSRADALAVMRQNGAINADEWRELENMGPEPDGQGKLYLVQTNMAPLGQLEAIVGSQIKKNETPPPAPEPPKADEDPEAERKRILSGFERVIRATAEHMVAREAKAVRNALDRAEKRGMQDFHAWLGEFYAEQPDILERAYLPALLGFAEATERAGEPDVRDHLSYMVAEDAGHSEQQIRAILKNIPAEEQVEQIRGLLAEWEQTRPAEIARREVAWRPDITLSRAA